MNQNKSDDLFNTRICYQLLKNKILDAYQYWDKLKVDDYICVYVIWSINIGLISYILNLNKNDANGSCLPTTTP